MTLLFHSRVSAQAAPMAHLTKISATRAQAVLGFQWLPGGADKLSGLTLMNIPEDLGAEL